MEVFGESKIRKYDMSVLIYEDIGCFDISMDDASRMKFRKGDDLYRRQVQNREMHGRVSQFRPYKIELGGDQ